MGRFLDGEFSHQKTQLRCTKRRATRRHSHTSHRTERKPCAVTSVSHRSPPAHHHKHTLMSRSAPALPSVSAHTALVPPHSPWHHTHSLSPQTKQKRLTRTASAHHTQHPTQPCTRRVSARPPPLLHPPLIRSSGSPRPVFRAHPCLLPLLLSSLVSSYSGLSCRARNHSLLAPMLMIFRSSSSISPP